MTGEERRAELVDAAIACMAHGGIQDFTVDKICVRAGVSRGLITHHFGTMNALLTEVYATMYERSTHFPQGPQPGQSRLAALLDAYFSPSVFNRDSFMLWLTLWGQITINPDLRDEHRAQYPGYVRDVASAIAEVAAGAGREVDAVDLARALICLVDGLGVQHCIEPNSMPPEAAKSLCRVFLEPHLGPLDLAVGSDPGEG